MNKKLRSIAVGTAFGVATVLGACSAKGSHTLTCQSTEVAPNSQPGAKTPQAALEWYLKHGNSGLPKTGFKLSGHTATRSVYSNGTQQISVSTLPAEKGEARIWVVMMTYDCS